MKFFILNSSFLIKESMDIHTRFDIGTEVWTMERNDIRSFRVHAVRIKEINGANLHRKPCVLYCERHEGPLPGNMERYTWYEETDLFASKEELLNVLMEMD